jgi:hypothetical protein
VNAVATFWVPQKKGNGLALDRLLASEEEFCSMKPPSLLVLWKQAVFVPVLKKRQMLLR